MAGLPDEDIPTMSLAELEAVVAAETPAAATSTSASARPGDGRTRSGVPVTTESPFGDEPPTANNLAPGAKPAEPAEEEDCITATTPRAEAPKIPLSLPGRVEIRTIEPEDEVDTEVKTLAAAKAASAAKVDQAPKKTEEDEDDDGATMTAQAPAPAGPAVARAPSPIGDDTKDDEDEDEDEDEDGATVTTQAPAPRVGSVPDPAPDVIRISPRSLVGKPQPKNLLGDPPEPSTLTGDNPTVTGPTGAKTSESVTSPKVAASAADAYAEDSVTALAPLSPAIVDAARARVLGRPPSAPASGDTDATTRKKPHPPASPADGEVESITTQAPGHLTNMLRVLASERPAALEDDEPENNTAVMPNAPVKDLGSQKHGTLHGMGPVPSPIGRPPPTASMGAAALRLDPSSESGLRAARAAVTSGEHANIGALGVQAHERASGAGGIESEARLAHAPTEAATYPLGITTGDAPPPRAPRYGLLVTVVAAISIAIPVSLYVVLHSERPLLPLTPAQASGDVVKRGDPVRPKATKGAPSSSASGSKKPQHR